jgi:parallel beta-helix repeat protein
MPRLSPGDSIQTAIDQAVPGTVITLSPGAYYERLWITTPGITLESEDGAILHGGTLVPEWEPASGVGSGVWQAALPYTPYALTAGTQAIWRINDDTMHGNEVYGTNGDGFYYLTRPASGNYTGNIGYTVTSYWDGIEALFGAVGSLTYVRFRAGDDPQPMELLSAPAGAVVTIDGVSGVTLRGLTILGGETQVEVRGASDTTLHACLLSTGRRRVLIGEGATRTRLEHCEMTSASLGMAVYQPGEWQRDAEEYLYIVRAHQYNENKFCCGRTTEDSTDVYVHDATDTHIENCFCTAGIVGISLWGGSGTRITNNVISDMGAQGIWLHEGASHAEIGDNLLTNCEHLMRVQDCEDLRTRTYYFYHNQCWQPRPDSQSPKHINTSFAGVDGQAVSASIELWVYHNSFAGGGWAVDAGNSDHQLPYLTCVNNIFSTRGIASGGGTRDGVFAYNWSSCGFAPHAEEGNVAGEARLWEDTTLPDFVVPEGSSAASGALDVSQPFTIAGLNYPALPGCTEPQAAFGARGDVPVPPEPEPEPEAGDKRVTTVIRGLSGGGVYTVRVQVVELDGGTVVAENSSAPFEVAGSPPVVEVPLVEDV